MSGSSYKKKIVIDQNFLKIQDFINNLPNEFRENGEVIYKSRNIIKTFIVDDIPLNVKSFKTPHLINQFAYATIRESKAKRSYQYAQRLLDNGINTPTPIAYSEYKKPLRLINSFYISEQIAVDGEMRVIQKGSFESHKELITQFAQFTADLHEKQILHIDYSPGNILYNKENEKYSFYLVDLNRMEFGKTIEADKAAKNFRRLWGSQEMISFFAQEYAKLRKFDPTEFSTATIKYWTEFWVQLKKKYPNENPYLGE